MLLLAVILKWIDFLFIVYRVAAVRSKQKRVRVQKQQKAKGTSRRDGGL